MKHRSAPQSATNGVAQNPPQRYQRRYRHEEGHLLDCSAHEREELSAARRFPEADQGLSSRDSRQITQVAVLRLVRHYSSEDISTINSSLEWMIYDTLRCMIDDRKQRLCWRIGELVYQLITINGHVYISYSTYSIAQCISLCYAFHFHLHHPSGTNTNECYLNKPQPQQAHWQSAEHSSSSW